MKKILKLSLDRLKELYNEGVYTEEQFILKREKLLKNWRE